jgi:hypothetical protein
VRISTSLVEFEEMPGIQTFFELDSSDSKPTSLFIVLEDRLLACVEIIRGTVDEGIDLELEKSIEAEVNPFGGFISRLHEDYPDDISTKFTFNGKEINQYHIFKFGEVSLTAHLTILSDWMDEDLVKIHKFLSAVELREKQFVSNQVGEILQHKNFSEFVGYKVGLRSYLGSHLAVIQ